MIEKLSNENRKEYEAFVRAHPNGNLFQTPLWRKQKPHWDWRAVLRRDAQGTITGTMAILIRRLPIIPWSFLYCCRGPVCDPTDEETLRELLREAKNIANREHAYCLRLDPLMAAGSCESTFSTAGFRRRTRRHTIQPSCIRRILIHRNTLSDISAEHLQSIRMAIQRNLTIRQGGRELIPLFTELMHQAALRDNFVARSEDYYATITEHFGDAAQVFLAEYEGRITAAALVVQHGSHITSLFECDDGDITLRAAYLLRSAILHYAVEQDCTHCDFPQHHPDLMHDAFAAGFGGVSIPLIGEWDLVCRPLLCLLASAAGAVRDVILKHLFFLKIR